MIQTKKKRDLLKGEKEKSTVGTVYGNKKKRKDKKDRKKRKIDRQKYPEVWIVEAQENSRDVSSRE